MTQRSHKRTGRRTSRAIRVAIVCSHLEIGGQESGVISLLRRFDRTRITPLLYTFRGGPHLRTIRQLGIPVVIGSRRRRGWANWTRADALEKAAFRRRLASAFRADRIDVCLIYAWSDAIAAAREAGVPAIVERVDGPKLIGWLRDKSSCQRLICQSDAIRRLLLSQREWFRCTAVPVAVVRNGIDLEVFDPDRYDRARSRRALGLSASDFVIGSIARLAPVKNLGHVLDAVHILLHRGGEADRVKVVIAGPDDGDARALRNKTRALGLGRQVRFLGARHDVPRVLSALDVFVLPSIQEGTPFALLEAMAMGLPVIASQSDSIAELVRDNGILVGPLDPYRTMVALRLLMRQHGLQRELGRRSRQIARRHGIDAMARHYEQELLEAFSAGQRQPAFRRRVAVVPGHARSGTDLRAIDRVYRSLRRRGIDAYSLALSETPASWSAEWPPPRQQNFPSTIEGSLARLNALDWLAPDVIITDCAGVVREVRRMLPGEQIVFAPDSADTCRGRAQALRAADDLLRGESAVDLDAAQLERLLTRARPDRR